MVGRLVQQPASVCGGGAAVRIGQWKLRLWGAVALSGEERAVAPFPQAQKALALAGLLALSPERRLPRETVAGLLWSERDDRRARGNLRQLLAQVREADPDGAILEVSPYRLRLASGVVDQAQQALMAMHSFDASALDDAMPRVGDRLLGSVSACSPALEDWLETVEAAEWARLEAAALEMLLRLEEVPAERRLALLQPLMRFDPLNESFALAAAEAESALGRRGSARRRIDALGRRLKAELGVELAADLPCPEPGGRVVADRQPREFRADVPVTLPRRWTAAGTVGSAAAVFLSMLLGWQILAHGQVPDPVRVAIESDGSGPPAELVTTLLTVNPGLRVEQAEGITSGRHQLSWRAIGNGLVQAELRSPDGHVLWSVHMPAAEAEDPHGAFAAALLQAAAGLAHPEPTGEKPQAKVVQQARAAVQARSREAYAMHAARIEAHLARRPDDAAGWAELSILRILSQGGRADPLARIAGLKAVAADPQIGRGHAALGFARLLDEPGRAVRTLQRAVELDPEDRDALYWLALAEIESGQEAAGRMTLARLSSIHPTWSRGAVALVGALSAAGERSAAWEVIEAFRTGGGHPADLPHLEGLLLESEGRLAEAAAAHLVSAKGSAPASGAAAARATEILAFLRAPDRADFQTRLGPMDVAVVRADPESLRLAIEDLPDDSAYPRWRRLARMGLNAQLLDEAAVVVQTEAQPRLHWLRCVPPVIVALRASGRDAEADQLLWRAGRFGRSLASGSLTAHTRSHLAEIWALEGRTDAAIAELQAAMTQGWFPGSGGVGLGDNPVFAAIRSDPRFVALERDAEQLRQRELAVLMRGRGAARAA